MVKLKKYALCSVRTHTVHVLTQPSLISKRKIEMLVHSTKRISLTITALKLYVHVF